MWDHVQSRSPAATAELYFNPHPLRDFDVIIINYLFIVFSSDGWLLSYNVSTLEVGNKWLMFYYLFYIIRRGT